MKVPESEQFVVVLPPQKSVGLAFILTFFFGPLGMLYSTVSGAMIMMGVAIIGGFFFSRHRLLTLIGNRNGRVAATSE